jgi:hypothetical protein
MLQIKHLNKFPIQKNTSFSQLLFLFLSRCLWTDRDPNNRTASRKISVRARRILPNPLPEPAHPIRTTPSPTSVAPNRLVRRHRAALLRPARREDSDWDVDPGHAAFRNSGQRFPVADGVTVDAFDVGFVAAAASSESHRDNVVDGNGASAGLAIRLSDVNRKC